MKNRRPNEPRQALGVTGLAASWAALMLVLAVQPLAICLEATTTATSTPARVELASPVVEREAEQGDLLTSLDDDLRALSSGVLHPGTALSRLD